MARLNRLQSEWHNRQQADYYDEHGRLISMRLLEEKLLALKETVSYKENWRRLSTKALSRHAWDTDYIASLLYLIDERCLPISDLQPTIHLQLGHLYRQLRRAGVIFRAHSKGIGARLRHDYHPYPGVVYFDPLSGIYLKKGNRYLIPQDAFIFKSENADAENGGEREEVLSLLGDDANTDVPLPLIRTKSRPPKKPPIFHWSNRNGKKTWSKTNP